jgi:cysteine desulfurase/selenocysteine lyase
MSLLAPSRADFPVLPHTGVAYLDSGATSQTPLPVIDAMDAYYREYRASIHRGIYPIAALATEAYESAREKVAAFAGSAPGETVFTRNATEAINLVAYSWGSTNVGAGDLIVLTEMEHHSNIVPWQMLCQRTGAELAYVPIDDEGLLIEDELDALLARGPKLVAVAHISNVLGTVNDIGSIARRAHDAGALLLVDGSQAAPHLPLDVHALDADFYAWTAHKAYGPTGIGALHARREILETMPPFLGGGHMIAKVERESSRYAEPPARFEAGTSAIAEAVGFGAAVDYLGRFGMDAVWEHSRDVVGYAVEQLRAVEGLEIHGPSDLSRRGSVISFALDGIHPHDVAEILGREGVCVRAGHHCAQVLMQRLGVSATTRASFAIHSTHDDVDRLIAGLAKVQEVFA